MKLAPGQQQQQTNESNAEVPEEVADDVPDEVEVNVVLTK